MNCEKCQDRGFTEENHGLTMILCDCEAGKRKREELGLPDTKFNHAEAINNAVRTGGEGLAQLKQDAHELGIDFNEGIDDSNSRAGQPNSDIGSADTRKPKQPKKPKAKRKAGKRAK